MFRILVVIAAIIIALLILRFLLRGSPQKISKILRWFAVILAVIGVLFLLLTGRLHWVFALAAAMIPVARRIIPLIRYLPLVGRLFTQYHSRKRNKHTHSTGQQSHVSARFVKMTLDHDSGNMDGLILQGRYQNCLLSSLDISQLIQLIAEWNQDADSLALLESYLDRAHPDWRSQSNYDQYSSEINSDGHISEDEAYQILGLEKNADRDAIIKAHRKLMQKLHPDQGGSSYLAAKINLAKDFLLKNTSTQD